MPTTLVVLTTGSRPASTPQREQPSQIAQELQKTALLEQRTLWHDLAAAPGFQQQRRSFCEAAEKIVAQLTCEFMRRRLVSLSSSLLTTRTIELGSILLITCLMGPFIIAACRSVAGRVCRA